MQILEIILFKNLFNYIKDHNLLFKSQSGFQHSDSTITQLNEIHNIIISNLDRGKDIIFIFVIYQKHLIQYGINVSSINYKKIWNQRGNPWID